MMGSQWVLHYLNCSQLILFEISYSSSNLRGPKTPFSKVSVTAFALEAGFCKGLWPWEVEQVGPVAGQGGRQKLMFYMSSVGDSTFASAL